MGEDPASRPVVYTLVQYRSSPATVRLMQAPKQRFPFTTSLSEALLTRPVAGGKALEKVRAATGEAPPDQAVSCIRTTSPADERLLT